jgi:hypothetical protein
VRVNLPALASFVPANCLSQQIGTKLVRAGKLTLTTNWNKIGQDRQIDFHSKLVQNWPRQANKTHSKLMFLKRTNISGNAL